MKTTNISYYCEYIVLLLQLNKVCFIKKNKNRNYQPTNFFKATPKLANVQKTDEMHYINI